MSAADIALLVITTFIFGFSAGRMRSLRRFRPETPAHHRSTD
jgi:hypothetical protein